MCVCVCVCVFECDGPCPHLVDLWPVTTGVHHEGGSPPPPRLRLPTLVSKSPGKVWLLLCPSQRLVTLAFLLVLSVMSVCVQGCCFHTFLEPLSLSLFLTLSLLLLLLSLF